MDWFRSVTHIPEQLKEFQVYDSEVEVNELLLAIKFLFLSDIFKQLINPGKLTLSSHSIVQGKCATLTLIKHLCIKIPTRMCG